MTTGDAIPLALSWLATYWLHSTLFLGGAWLLCRARPPKLDRNRERVWKLALVGGLLSATLQLSLGARPLLGRIELQPARSDGASAEPSHLAPPPELAASPRPEPAARGQAPELVPVASAAPPLERRRADTSRPAVVGGRPRFEPAPASARGGTAASEATRALAPGARDAGERSPEPARLARASTWLGTLAHAWSRWNGRWPGLVLALWSAIGLTGVAGLIASWTCLHRRMLGRELLRDGALLARFERLCRRAGVRRRVRLTLSDRIPSPFSTGWLRPEVCLPRAVLSDLSIAQQDALLAHELGHLVRRDPAWFGLGSLIERLLFFQPLNRLARRQLSELAEEACDDWAVRWTGARLALASCLAEVAGWVVGEERRLLAPPGLAGYRSRLGRRVERLLDDRRSPSGEPPARWWPPLSAAALALVALAGPGVSAARESAPAPRVVPPARTDPRALAAALEPREEAETLALEASGPATLSAERGALASELALLELELAALHAELEASALRERFEGELARIDARMSALREQHRLVAALLARVAAHDDAPRTPAPSAAAPAGAPAHTESTPEETQGDPR